MPRAAAGAALLLTAAGSVVGTTRAARMSPDGRARAAAEYKLQAPPIASFAWFPSPAIAGRPVTLVSTSSDRTSPITAWAWDTSDNGSFGAFVPGGPATTATFPTPAEHVLRLRVTNASNLSDVVAETIAMRQPPPGVMFPFPTIRISGAGGRAGVTLKRVVVSAPALSRITVICHGRRCPVRFIERVASRARINGRAVATRLRGVERSLPGGVTLQFRVSGEGEIGAYTRFTVPPRGIPVRVDSCLDPSGAHPITCPS
jgi:PKD domain